MVDRLGVDVIVPKAEEIDQIHNTYMDVFYERSTPAQIDACVKLRALSSRATGAAAEAVLLAVRSPYPLSP